MVKAGREGDQKLSEFSIGFMKPRFLYGFGHITAKSFSFSSERVNTTQPQKGDVTLDMQIQILAFDCVPERLTSINKCRGLCEEGQMSHVHSLSSNAISDCPLFTLCRLWPGLDAGRIENVEKVNVLGWPLPLESQLIPYLCPRLPFAIWSYGPGYRLTLNNV